MKIDERVEPIVRAGIHAAVKRDFPQLNETLRGLSDDETARQAVELALAVIVFVMTDMHGGKPTDAQVRAVAAEAADAESWAQPSIEEVNTFLARLVHGEPFTGAVPVQNVFILSFALAGHLLSSNRRDDEKWWDYLDRVEAALETAGP